MTIRANRDYARVLLYCYFATIAGWGGLLLKDTRGSHAWHAQAGCDLGVCCGASSRVRHSDHVGCSLNWGVIYGIASRTTTGVIMGDTRSLDCGSFVVASPKGSGCKEGWNAGEGHMGGAG